MAGEGQEHVVERGRADRDVLHADPSEREPARGVHDRARALRHRHGHERAVRMGRLLAHALQRAHRRERRRRVRERDLQTLPADAGLELLRGALGDHAAMLDHRDPVRQAVSFVEVLRGQQDRGPVGHERLDRLPQIQPRARVQARRRLVEEDHRRARDQCRRQVQPPAHPARVRLGHPSARLGEIEALEQLVRAHLRLRPPLAVQPPDHDEVLDPGQVVVDRRVLTGEPDPRAQRRGFSHHIEPGHPRGPGIGLQQRGEHAHRRGLPGPVRAEHAEHGARRGLQVDPVKGAHRPERLHEALDADGRLFDHSHRHSVSKVQARICPQLR